MADIKATLKHNLYMQLVALHAITRHTAMVLMTNFAHAVFLTCSCLTVCCKHVQRCQVMSQNFITCLSTLF